MAEGKNLVGVDIGSSAIKVVQLRELRKGYSLAKVAYHELPPQTVVDGYAPVLADEHVADLDLSGGDDALVLVKGVKSHIVAPGGPCWRYAGGGPGLGVSGSGDVLAGIVGGLLARGATPLDALLWGVWLHGEAGRRLGETVGPVGFLAREIPGEVPALIAQAVA